MSKTIETIANNLIDVIDEQIDNTIHWQLYDDNFNYTNEIKLKVKQQVLFSILKQTIWIT